ncbi:MAG: CAP domain-containing protein [Trueperaceae bacterium]|nr:CAP domain-containing protein [Trueperaceae bacterium]
MIDYLLNSLLNVVPERKAIIRVCTSLAVTGLLLVGCTTPTSSFPNEPLPPLPDNNETATRQLIDLINEKRASGYTCPSGTFGPTQALSENEALEEAALKHSHDMEVNNFFAHQSQNDGTRVEDRVEAAGYGEFRKVGENLARFSGQVEASDVLDIWLTSDQFHCRALMDSDFTEVGVGVVDFGDSPYWTAVFANPQ